MSSDVSKCLLKAKITPACKLLVWHMAPSTDKILRLESGSWLCSTDHLLRQLQITLVLLTVRQPHSFTELAHCSDPKVFFHGCCCLGQWLFGLKRISTPPPQKVLETGIRIQPVYNYERTLSQDHLPLAQKQLPSSVLHPHLSARPDSNATTLGSSCHPSVNPLLPALSPVCFALYGLFLPIDGQLFESKGFSQ